MEKMTVGRERMRILARTGREDAGYKDSNNGGEYPLPSTHERWGNEKRRIRM